MGNLCATSSPDQVTRRPSRRCSKSSSAVGSSSRWLRARSSRTDSVDDAFIQEQALAAAILFERHQREGSLRSDRSSSLRYSTPNGSRKHSLPRSSSSRARSVTDPLLQPHQLIDKNVDLTELEATHFILVHGGGFGAWCWYKTIALLEESGFSVTAVDLAGSGINSLDTNKITSLSQYVKPLTDILEVQPDGEKVILVGHDFGGTCISFAMELFSFKISKAVYVSAVMLSNGQSTLDIFSNQEHSNKLIQEAQIFQYANGKDRTPTAIDLDKLLLVDLFFNQSSSKDIALASVSMRPIPFTPTMERITLSQTKYGSVPRFYIQTTEDNAIPVLLQESMTISQPVERIFSLKGADHSPFFSKPHALHKILVEIARITSN